MRRQVLFALATSGLIGVMVLGAAAQEAPPADATPGAYGTSGVPLGASIPQPHRATGCRWWN